MSSLTKELLLFVLQEEAILSDNHGEPLVLIRISFKLRLNPFKLIGTGINADFQGGVFTLNLFKK